MPESVVSENIVKVHRIGLFLDKGEVAGTRAWQRMMKSTELTLAMNGETETKKYIVDESPTDILKLYKPTINQALTAVKGSADYDFIWKKFFYNLAVGSKADIAGLIVFMDEPGTVEGSMLAWEFDCTIMITEMNGVAETLTFDILFKGTVRKGTVVATDGVPVFTEAS